MGPGVATGSTKHPNRTVSAYWVGGKFQKVEYNYVPDCRYHIGDFGRGAQPTQYREKIKLQVLVEEKNYMPGMRNGDDGRLYDISPPMNTWNRSIDQLVQDHGDPTQAHPPSILGHLLQYQ